MNADFTYLYQKYKNMVFSYVYYLSGDWSAAEEICQDVFLKVYLNISKFEGRSSFKTWLYRIAKNTYLNFAQSSKKEPCRIEPGQLDQSPADKKSCPEAHALNRELQENILKTLKGMDYKYRTLIILRDIQNMTYREISEITGQELNNVKVAIYRARKDFREKYAGVGGDYEL